MGNTQTNGLTLRVAAIIVGLAYLLDPAGMEEDVAEIWADIREGVLAALPAGSTFEPLMTCYLADDTDPDAPGRMYTRFGAFLPEFDHFSAAFFGISPREAQFMDPQQRQLLEVHWEALENAGIIPQRLAQQQVGIFVGMGTTDYSDLQQQLGLGTDAYNGTGGSQKVTLTGSGPNFSISASPNTLTVVHGSAGTSTISLTPQAKFTGNVTVSCTGAPANSTCSLNPTVVNVPPGSAATSTLTIQTTATTAPGVYTLTVTGTLAPLANAATITLTVQ